MTLAILALSRVAPMAGQEPTEKTFTIPHVLEVVGKAADQPMPRGLSAADQKSYAAQTEWLKSVRSRVEDLGVKAGIMATDRRQYDPIKFQKEVAALQKAVEAESRQFTMLSNVMKTRHDTAMNAIRNMK
jgi:cytochrome c556